MSEKKRGERRYTTAVRVPSIDQAKNAMEKVLVQLKASERLRLLDEKGRRRRLTQEAFLNLSWLWMEELPIEGLEDALVRHLPRLQAMLEKKPDPGALGRSATRIDLRPQAEPDDNLPHRKQEG